MATFADLLKTLLEKPTTPLNYVLPPTLQDPINKLVQGIIMSQPKYQTPASTYVAPQTQAQKTVAEAKTYNPVIQTGQTTFGDLIKERQGSAQIAGVGVSGTNDPFPKITPTKFDINPETGKPYGLNPATNSMDDNYWATVVEPALKSKVGYMSPQEQSLLTKNLPSNVSYEKSRQEASAELMPYYEKLLAESNGDIELAKQRLEEDYQKGLRTARQDTDVSMKNTLGNLVPSEQTSMMDELNRRGLLGTREGMTSAPSATLSTGEKVIAPMPTNVKFGGLGGKFQSQLNTTQNARQEAIQRALQRQEEDAGLTRNREMADYTTKQTRNKSNLEQERNTNIGTLAASKYDRALQSALLRTSGITEPYTG